MGNKSEGKFSWKQLARSIWFLFGLGEKRKQFIFWMIFLFVILLYNVVPPLIIGAVVDFFTGYQEGNSIARFYFLIISLGGSMMLVAILRLSAKKKLGLLRNETVYQIGVRGFEAILSQSLLENAKHSAGEKAQKVQNGIVALKDFYGLLTNDIMGTAAALSGMLVVFIYLSPKYALFFLLYIGVFFCILKFFTSRLSHLNYERNKALEKSSGTYIEGLSNIVTLKSLGSEKAFQGKVVEREMVSKGFMDQLVELSNLQWKTFQVVNGLSMGLFLWLLGVDVLNKVLSIGGIVVFFSYFERITQAASKIMDIYNDLIQSKMGIGRMMDIFGERAVTGGKRMHFPMDWKDIALENVSFFHKPGVGLKNVAIAIAKGERIGIIGKTGSGKSTLAKLFLGLYPLAEGKYMIGGKDFTSLKAEEVFQNISVVPQDVEMFNMSFRDNITLLRNIDSDLLEKAIDVAQLREVIGGLPEGLDVIIGEKGYRLSGGERQRVGIARALCRESQILILDEATSALDSKTESLIQKGLEKSFPQKTIIAIAHRTTTLENYDRIYVFEKGRIVEEGKYADLKNDPTSHFNKMHVK